MNTFTEKELNMLYFSMSKRVEGQKKVLNSIDKEKWPDVYASELRAFNELIKLQEKIDDIIWGRNKNPEIVD